VHCQPVAEFGVLVWVTRGNWRPAWDSSF